MKFHPFRKHLTRAAMISLLWPCVMLSAPLHAELPQTDETLLSQRKQQIETSLKSGNLTPLQAEFMLLASRNFDSPRDRLMAMREWQSRYGDAMKAELAAKRAQEEPQRQARIAAARQSRSARIEEGLATGRLGSMEAEFATLMNREFENPRERMRAIRAWYSENRVALDAERQTRHGADKETRDERLAEIQARRSRGIAEAVAAGRLGPLEAELLELRGQTDRNLKERHESIRAWLAVHGEALQHERAARATSGP